MINLVKNSPHVNRLPALFPAVTGGTFWLALTALGLVLIASTWSILAQPQQLLAGTRALLAWPGLGSSTLLSLWSGIASTLISIWLAKQLVGRMIAGRLGWLNRLLSPILAVPHAAVATAVVLTLAPSGWLFKLISPWATGWTSPPGLHLIGDPAALALIVGLVVKEVAFLLFVFAGAVKALGLRQHFAAGMTLGLTPAAAYDRLCWPHIWKRGRVSVVLVLVYAIGNVEMALILGPNLPPLLGPRVLNLFADADPQIAPQALPAALWLALVSAISAIVIVGLGDFWQRHQARRAAHGPQASWLFEVARWTGLVGALFVLALFWLGQIATTLTALSARRWPFSEPLPNLDWSAFSTRLVDALPAAGTSLALAVLACLLALVPSLLCLEHLWQRGHRALPRWLSALLISILLVPQLLMFIAMYRASLSIGLGPSFSMVLFGHMVVTFAYSFLMMAESYLKFPNTLLTQAASLGLPPWRQFFQVRLPVMLPQIGLVAAVAVSVSLALYVPTLVLGGGRVETLLSESVHFTVNWQRAAMASFALLQTLLAFAFFAAALLVPVLLFHNRKGVGL